MSAEAQTATAGSDLVGLLQAAVEPGTRDALCRSVLPAILDSIADIAKALRAAHDVALAGTANAFGDDQLNVDVAAEDILRAALAGRCPTVVTASSEEDPVEKAVVHPPEVMAAAAGAGGDEQYTVAFDPLDGSSIIAPNWTVGTIVSIFDGATALHQDPASRQVAAVLGVLGPRTTAVVAVRVPGREGVLIEVGLGEGCGPSGCRVVRPRVRLAEGPVKTRYFAPANLRSAAEEPRYKALLDTFIRDRWTLRYCGGLVPDIVHALVKGHGLYVNPVTGRDRAKLRRLYELFPIALVLECAGGRALDPVDGTDILARPAADTDERGGLICGTAADVEFACNSLLGRD